MMIIEITQGQIVWFAGVAFITIAGIFYSALYNRDWSYNDEINLGASILIITFLSIGFFTMFLGLNMDYKWLQIEVVSK